MRRPRIGIPLSLDDRGRWRAGRHYHYIDRRYADAIEKAGGIALQLPIRSDAAPLIGCVDGLLVPGGDDLPSASPLPPEVRLDLVPEEQLRFDRALVEAAGREGLPILGICYGMQLMALVEGGRLDAHLPTQRPEASDHKPADPGARHPITIDPESLLAQAMGGTRFEVNTLHHQAIRETGPAMRVVARSPDGVIEGVEARDDGFRIGVQWHPEKLDRPESDGLFRSFVEACRASARTRIAQSAPAPPGQASVAGAE